MKLGVFIAAALCVASPAHADHLAMIEQYQKAYGETPDPHLLTMIANEYRDAGKQAEALSYYCSYIFIAPAGDDADYASQQVHALRPGTESDHDACTAQKPVTHADVDTLAALPRMPPAISKREIAGISSMLAAIGTFAFALYQGKQGDDLHAKLATIDPALTRPTWADASEAKMNTYYSREKWLLAGGGALIVTGAALYLIGRHDRLKDAPVIAPTVGKHSAGMTLMGKF